MSNLTLKDRVLNFYRTRPLIVFGILVCLAAVGAVIGTIVLVSIFQHKQEARNPFFKVVELTEESEDPAIWGKNFPLQYDDYRRTVDQQRTRYGGSEAEPHTPTKADPRSVVAQSRIEEDPRLKTMWAGYAFAKDFREERGHAFMLDDQTYTERQQVAKQPGTCLHCHASLAGPYKKLGDGDPIKGFEKMNQMPFAEARKLVTHPVACIDCHEPTTMQLRVTRPGFIEGMRAHKASAGVKDYDVNRDATRQEMRSFVCGQCHVEYHFKGPEKRLVYPWADGLKVENILAYYDKEGFKDWVHADTGAPVLKAQHPEFEMWNQGIHARSGVACADCHMPYKREGALKISDHHVRSPLLNINHACQTCHKWPEAELKARVETIQERTQNMRNLAMDALVDLIGELKTARAANAPLEQVTAAQDFQRKAQFYLDFVEAENSTGFHAPQEALRILGESINFARKGQLALRPVEVTVQRPRMTELLNHLETVAVLVFLVSSMASMGLTLTPRAIAAPLRDVRFVLLALALNFVLAPACAWLLTIVIPLDRGHAAGLMLLGGAAGAPFLPKLVETARGDLASAAALMALLTAGTILFMPFALPLMIAGLTADPWSIARPLLMLIIAPLAAGMVVKSCATSFAGRAAPVLGKIGNVALLLLFALMIALNFRALLGVIGSGAILAALLFFTALFALGWLLGGPHRSVLSLATTARNFGAALAPAENCFDDPKVTVMIIVGAIVCLLVSFAAAGWVRRGTASISA